MSSALELLCRLRRLVDLPSSVAGPDGLLAQN